ncbi:hypothetical protein [Arenibacter palladensis]|uniref:hypothetical protein n=1 Tax=Arenibacter palladensis TaxID=237373 RepID=UPI0026E39573|nr:hypothetical protein [Arenibacter palladensis]MDO6602847.1 hypothetical protein [Arenibacter palladensis]
MGQRNFGRSHGIPRKPEVSNMDQGCHFASEVFVRYDLSYDIKLSMYRKGRAMDLYLLRDIGEVSKTKVSTGIL